jgi:hypothetical protein
MPTALRVYSMTCGAIFGILGIERDASLPSDPRTVRSRSAISPILPFDSRQLLYRKPRIWGKNALAHSQLPQNRLIVKVE